MYFWVFWFVCCPVYSGFVFWILRKTLHSLCCWTHKDRLSGKTLTETSWPRPKLQAHWDIFSGPERNWDRFLFLLGAYFGAQNLTGIPFLFFLNVFLVVRSPTGYLRGTFPVLKPFFGPIGGPLGALFQWRPVVVYRDCCFHCTAWACSLQGVSLSWAPLMSGLLLARPWQPFATSRSYGAFALCFHRLIAFHRSPLSFDRRAATRSFFSFSGE